MPPTNNRTRRNGESWPEYATRLGVSPTQSVINLLMQEEMNRLENTTERSNQIRFMEQVQQHWGQSMAMASMASELTPVPELVDVLQPAAHTHEREIKLRNLTNKILEERLQHRPQRSGSGQKEQQYNDLIARQKQESMTISEIVNSEIPLFLGAMPHQKIREIARIAHVTGIHSDKNTRDAFNIRCAQCNTDTHKNYAFFCLGSVYCAEHIPNMDMCNVCNDLTNNGKKIVTFDDRSIVACDGCIRRRTLCSVCNNAITSKYVEVMLCKEHVEQSDPRSPHRGFAKGLKWVSAEHGDIYKSKRMFSCEVEGLTPQKEWGYLLCSILPHEMGVTRDGSIDSKGEALFGFEVQTPKLGGKKGEELVHRLNSGLKEIHTSINDTCGMHVHLDAKGIMPLSRKEYPTSLIQLMKTYVVFEDVILSFLPFSRRRNDYCRPLTEILQVSEIDLLTNIVEIEKLWYRGRTHEEIRSAKSSHYHAARYFGTNLSPLLKEGHLEIRFHSGTINPKKILEWANLHALIMDACARQVFTTEFLREAQITSRLSEKTAMLFNAIGLAEISKQYFRTRQQKFGDKKIEDEEVKSTKKANIQFRRVVRTSSGRPIVRPPGDLRRSFRFREIPDLT